MGPPVPIERPSFVRELDRQAIATAPVIVPTSFFSLLSHHHHQETKCLPLDITMEILARTNLF